MTNNQTKPSIELRSIDFCAGASEETPCYSAKLYVDGRHFANVSNHGTGGCDDVYPATPSPAFNGELAALEARIAATYPEMEISGYKLKQSLECLCHGIVWRWDEMRKFRRTLSRKVLVRRDGHVYELRGRKTEGLLEAAKRQYGEDNVLNLMDVEAAFELVPDA